MTSAFLCFYRKALQDKKLLNVTTKSTKTVYIKLENSQKNAVILIQALVYAGNMNGTGSQNYFFSI